MRKISPVLLLLYIAGAVLGLWLTAEGLSVRFTGEYLTSGGLWQNAAKAAGLNADQLYWHLVWLGLTWFGVLASVWVKSSLRYKAVVAASILSLFFLGWGTLLAVVILVCAVSPSGRRLLREQETERTIIR